MSTLFIGRLRNKGDKLIAAAPQIAAGFQQAGDALRQYEADRNHEQQQQLLNAKVAADMAGGWAYLPTETQNALPSILGVDLPRDPLTGDVKIEKTFDNLIEESARKRAMADPGTAATYGLIKEGVMTKMANPADRELAVQKINSDFAAKQYSADLGYRKMYLDDRLKRDRMDLQHSYDMEKTYAANAAKGLGDKDPSELYLDDNGDPINSQQKAVLEQEGVDTSRYLPLTMKQAKLHIDRFRADTTRRNQNSLEQKREYDKAILADRLAERAAFSPEMKAATDQLKSALQVGDKKAIEQAQLQLQGIVELEAKDANISPDNYNDSVMSMWKFWQSNDNLASFMGAAARKRAQAARDRVTGGSEPSPIAPSQPDVHTGQVGNTTFTYTRIPTRSASPGSPVAQRATTPPPGAVRVPNGLTPDQYMEFLTQQGVMPAQGVPNSVIDNRQSQPAMPQTGMSQLPSDTAQSMGDVTLPVTPGWKKIPMSGMGR